MKILHHLLKGVSLTGALFVFQACDGTPRAVPFEEQGMAPMSFSLVSQATGKPLEGIRIMGGAVRTDSKTQLGITGADGSCEVEIPYVRNMEGPFLSFVDPAGKHVAKDTSLTDLRERQIMVKLTPIQ